MQHRNYALSSMLQAGYLTPEQAQEASQEPVPLSPPPLRVHKAFYFVEYVRQYLEEQYGPTALYRGGFTVETTLDLHLQEIAEQTLRQGLVALDRRYGVYGGPVRRLALTGNAAADATMIEAVTLPPNSEPTVREGEHLQGVVLAIRGDSGALVAIKNTRGVLPHSGYAWARHIDSSLPAEVRRQM